MTEIDKIVADERVQMTKTLDRAFRAAGCAPACHCCKDDINLGDYFKLAQVIGKDEMLCDSCKPIDLIIAKVRWKREYREHVAEKRAGGRGGFSRAHKPNRDNP